MSMTGSLTREIETRNITRRFTCQSDSLKKGRMCVTQAIPPPLRGDENGYEAWLNYREEPDEDLKRTYRTAFASFGGPLPAVAKEELTMGIRKIVGMSPEFLPDGGTTCFSITATGKSLGEEDYRIKPRGPGLLIEAGSEKGLLYGSFALIAELQLGKPVDSIAIESRTSCPIRILNHWDDPKFDHTLGPYNVTRGFAGNSLFNWSDLLEENPRYRDYARLVASIGINAVCLNNVNADPDVLESTFLSGVQAMADRLRPYNIKVFLSVPFTAPMVCDGEKTDEEYGEGYPFCMRNRKVRRGTLETADPLDVKVQDWWKKKADEIYKRIPDFGGYVIKANSEGMPGPQDYGRNHAEGANCLARSLAPHGGLLFYRTFVYEWAKNPEKNRQSKEACCQAFDQFKPLDGQFDDNVIVQSKAGPADFRSHEPPNPLLGAMPDSRQAVEFMIAQEYLGQTTHVCFQAKDWHSILNFDTHQKGAGTTVASVVSGSANGYKSGAIIGVANLGDDANWFGHLLAGANLYAFGCLAWNPQAKVDEIMSAWTCRTFGRSSAVHDAVFRILNESYDVYARYTVPLGLNYMHEANHHFEPRIAALKPAVWNSRSVGYKRGGKKGSGLLELYREEARKEWESPETTPLPQLLFFHNLPWSYKLPNGKSLARHIRDDRITAVENVRNWLEQWRSLKDDLNAQTWAHVYERLQRQYVHAGKWRDAGLKALREVGQLDDDKIQEVLAGDNQYQANRQL